VTTDPPPQTNSAATQADISPDAPIPQAPRSFPAGAAALGSGALVAFSMPPWGWWPLALVGIAIYGRLTANCSRRARVTRAFIFAIGWFAPAAGWVWFLTAPGYPFVVLIFASYHAIAAAVAPTGKWRWLGLPAAHTVAEAIRFCFPFGGIPLASLAISQVAGPLAVLAPIGGAILMSWAALQLGAVLSELEWRQLTRPGFGIPTSWRTGVRSTLLGIGVLLLAMQFLPDSTHPTGTPVDVAFVQGGGPQGTRAINTSSRTVVERHLAATATLGAGPDLVVWPENVIDVDVFTESVERNEIAAEAERLNAPFLVGVTEEVPNRDAFLNAQIAVLPDGSVTGRYEKVRRVPFGEYMPMREFLRSISSAVDQVPRDAVAGTGPAYIDTPVGRVAVVISWEVFFGGRARDGTSQGGQLLINPTNGSSYTGTILQTQQVASSRLRARETGRWVVQVSPTGFSAFVSPEGVVHQRTAVSERAVRQMTLEMRDGRTFYNRVGDIPWVVLAAVVLLITSLLGRRRRHVGASENLRSVSPL
jgi:apolipoprotein N-acyltransferase